MGHLEGLLPAAHDSALFRPVRSQKKKMGPTRGQTHPLPLPLGSVHFTIAQ